MNRAVHVWLWIGIVMVFFQIVIGGITRLTGSGLSITEWDVVMGFLPPIGESAWLEEFSKYKLTPQYVKINDGMSLASFKFIYFWEYVHRLWARTMGIVFLIPFVFFMFRGIIDGQLLKNLLKVVGLAALAAIFGWIMVASGLVDRPWVNAYKLSIHLLIGFAVFAMLWWTILRYKSDHGVKKRLEKKTWILLTLCVLQLFLGGVMSGMKASLIYPTWPDMHGVMIPSIVFDSSQWTLQSFIDYDQNSFVFALVQLCHRSVAYLLFIGILAYTWIHRHTCYRFVLAILSAIVLVQCLLGVVTLLQSVGSVPVLWGVLHQAVAVLLMATFLVHVHEMRYSSQVS